MTSSAEARVQAAVAELAAALMAAVTADPQPTGVDRLYTIEQARQRLGGISRARIYKEIGSGRLRTVSAGRRRLIPSSAIDAFARGA